MTNETELLEEINKMFSGHPEVSDFLLLHNKYVHAVDAEVDNDKDKIGPLDVSELALRYYNHPVYVKHREALFPMCYTHHNTYRDSVYWEKADFDDKGLRKNAAKTLRHCSLDIFMVMVLFYAGPEALEKISCRMRGYTFEKHSKD